MRQPYRIEISIRNAKKASESNRGRKWPKEHGENISRAKKGWNGLFGTKWSAERRLRGVLKTRGENHWNWKGGKVDPTKKARVSVRWKIWREKVFKRDGYQCVLCGVVKVELHPDHIKSFSKYPRLRYVVSNGRTLCVPCHRKTSTYGKG